MITIIDYQMGNLRSVQNAFERVGAEAVVTSDHEQILAAEKVVLPGVGAFGDAMRELKQRQLCQAIEEVIARGTPFLGICLGLQLLFERSDESEGAVGLGVIQGDVTRFVLDAPMKVPHMGWNQLRPTKRTALLDDQVTGEHYYFVHSHYVRPKDADWIAAETDHGHPFCSMIARDNIFATQFHPEKSQAAGLAILSRFSEL